MSERNLSRASSHSSLRSNAVDEHPLSDHAPAEPPAKYVIYHSRAGSKSNTSKPLSSPSNAIFATAGTSPVASSSMPATASSKLHFQTLQASSQAAGLRSDSAGWILLLSLINGHTADGKGKEKERSEVEQWERLVKMLETQSGPHKILLLLPQESTSQQAATPAFLASHMLLCGPVGALGYRQVATLSGLRGIIEEDHLHLWSCVPIGGDADLSDLAHQDGLLGAQSHHSRAGDFPTFLLSPFKQPLSVPRHVPSKDNTSKKSGNPGTTSRLASLFGGKEAQSRAMLPPAATTPSANETTLPPFFEPSNGPAQPSLTVEAVVLERTLRLTEQRKAIKRAFEATLRSRLADQLGPLSERIAWQDAVPPCVTYVKSFFPPSRDWKPATVLNRFFEVPSPKWMEDCASAAQEMYAEVRQALEAKDEKADEGLADEVLQAFEDTVSDLLYDRIFGLSEVKDKAQDEALSTRIAGLNLLELSLEHLGLDIGDDSEDPSPDLPLVQSQLKTLVTECGAELKHLEDPDRRTPQSKLEVLIKAHKIIVDRLSSMPAVPMKKEAHPAPLPARPSGSTYEMTDDVKSLGGSHPPSLSSRQGSPTEKTPRPPSMRRSSDVPAISLSEPALEDSGPAQGKAKRPSSSADLILPLLIYSVVQSNPNQLASHLAFIQRFRADSLVRGEAAYCLVNMQAVMEFLLTVDLEALGLNAASILPPETVAASPELARVPANVRDKVSQELDSIAGHVGNTISGVAGVMSALLSRTAASPSSPKTIDEVRSVLSGSPQSPESKGAFGANLLKRASNPLNKTTDSIRSRSRSLFGGQPEETKEKELLDVAAPQVEHGSSNDSDTKPSIANRLASFARFGTPEVAKDAPSKAAFFNGFSPAASVRSRSRSPSLGTGSPPTRPLSLLSSELQTADLPVERFLTANADDLRLSDVPLLLQDYKRLAALLAGQTQPRAT